MQRTGLPWAGFVAAVAAWLVLAAGAPPLRAQPAGGGEAAAWCEHEGETVWSAPRPEQNALARVTLDMRCREGAVHAFRVKAETRCGRTLCTWSWSEVAQVAGPALEAVFFTFSATRTMRLLADGDQLSVEVHNDFNQPGRESARMQAIMTRD